MNEKDFKSALGNAKKIGLLVKRSNRKNKKLDVFRDSVKIASIGDSRYNDFHSYKRTKGIKFAKERQRLYRIRHDKTRKIKNTPSYFADKILWS